MRNRVVFALAASLFALPLTAAPIVFSDSGAAAADIQFVVDQYRAALGALNPNVPGSFGSGRRQIDWDGVPDAFSAPNNLPANFFNANSPRGAEFTTSGTGFQVSANAGIAPVEFGNLNPDATDNFAVFSPQRLFTALGSNVLDVHFFVPGFSTIARVRGFGAVFTDVDLPGTTIEYFSVNNTSLGVFDVPSIPAGSETLSFLGVIFDGAPVRSVRITNGNRLIEDPGDETAVSDMVAMDDFIYAEPTAVPEPSTYVLSGLGMALLAAVAGRRRRA